MFILFMPPIIMILKADDSLCYFTSAIILIFATDMGRSTLRITDL